MTQPMSDRQLEEIDVRASGATRGPWHVEYFGDRGYPQRIANDAAIVIAQTYDGEFPAQNYPARDAEFIAHAREDVPALLAEVYRLRKLLTAEERP